MSGMQRVRLGSRGSQLAMWQAHWTRDRLLENHPGLEVEIVEVSTIGDVDITTPLANIGQVGLFTHTLEQHLLGDRIDVAVHSLKDVPAQLARGCVMSGFSPREDARDAWFQREGKGPTELAEGATVATGSLRRRSQLLERRPDLRVTDLRGNLNTRWRKYEEGAFDAMILAAAGVKRLGWGERVSAYLSVDEMLPAVGQGILGLETRKDSPAIALLAPFNDISAERRARAERALLAGVAGGCVVPLAGHCTEDDDELHLRACLGRPDGTLLLRAEGRAASSEAEELGHRVAQDLLDQGGGEIVAQAKGSS